MSTPTKPSKFATEAANDILDNACQIVHGQLKYTPAKASLVIDQSFAPARTAFEELVKINEMLVGDLCDKLNHSKVDQHSQSEFCHLNRRFNHALSAAQKILADWGNK